MGCCLAGIALSASGDGPCVPSWTRQLKAANEEYAALSAKYLETDGAKQFIAEQQAAIAAAAERKEGESEAEDEDEDEGEEEQSATAKRKRRAPKQKKDPNGAVGALACRHSPRKTCLRPCQCVRLKQSSSLISMSTAEPTRLLCSTQEAGVGLLPLPRFASREGSPHLCLLASGLGA